MTIDTSAAIVPGSVTVAAQVEQIGGGGDNPSVFTGIGAHGDFLMWHNTIESVFAGTYGGTTGFANMRLDSRGRRKIGGDETLWLTIANDSGGIPIGISWVLTIALMLP
jgi:hypothetical protein